MGQGLSHETSAQLEELRSRNEALDDRLRALEERGAAKRPHERTEPAEREQRQRTGGVPRDAAGTGTTAAATR